MLFTAVVLATALFGSTGVALAFTGSSLPSDNLVVSQVPVVPATPADSKQISRRARAEQKRFERQRRLMLPWKHPSTPGRCEEVISLRIDGQFCLFTIDSGDSSWNGKAEPPEVRPLRDALVARLDSAAARLPGDHWIAGQRVKYLVASGRNREAIAAADQCAPPQEWWCVALGGFVRHADQEFVAAESLYTLALARMPREERCRWRDLSPFLSGGAKGDYRSLSCEARDSLETRFWWLADPLYLVAGNDRLTEHYTRHLQSHLSAHSEPSDGLRWGDDLERVLVRYGTPVTQARIRPTTGTVGHRAIFIASRYDTAGRRFLPEPGFTRDLSRIQPGKWPLEHERARTEYGPAYARSFEELEHQMAVFPRGDSMVVVSAYDLHSDSLSPGRAVRAALALAPNERGPVILVEKRDAATADALVARTEALDLLVSIEALSPGDQLAGRSRYWLTRPEWTKGSPAVSDLLVLSGNEVRQTEPIDSLAAAIPRTRGSLRVLSGDRVGLYWEVVGLEGPQLISTTLTLVKTSSSWLRKAVEFAKLAGRRDPLLSIAWEEATPADRAIFGRSLDVRLPDLSDGTYALRLDIELRSGAEITVVREIVVESEDS